VAWLLAVIAIVMAPFALLLKKNDPKAAPLGGNDHSQVGTVCLLITHHQSGVEWCNQGEAHRAVLSKTIHRQ
jgi:hypothetical protein